MSKQFWAVIIGIVVVLVGIFALTSDKKEPSSDASSKNKTTSHIKGASTTGVKLVEYGDFQCPSCKAYHSTINQVINEYGDRISFQYVHFPLTTIHQNAFAAARASEAADKQGKFWEMYDVLFQTADPNGTSGWGASNSPTTFFNQFAKQLGLDEAKFKKDYASSAANNAINADIAAGNKLEVNSTPTFYLDGKKISVNNSLEDFKKVIDKAIADKAKSSPTE